MKKEKWSKRHSSGFRKWLITVLLAISVLMTGYSVLKETGDVLLDQAKAHRSAEFTIPFDRQSLADYLGVERSALSAEISRMRRDSLIESTGSRFRLLKTEQ